MAATVLCCALVSCQSSEGTSAVPPVEAEPSLEILAREALQFSEQQLRQAVRARGPEEGYPRSAEGSTWQAVEPRDWTSGFFPGLLWQMYAYTDAPYWRQQAQRWTAGLESQKDNTGTHDLGFMLFDSFGQGYCLTGDSTYAAVTRQAARSLASRYDPDVGATKSWDWSAEWDFPVIVDNMMNLELLFWAAENGGGDRLREMASQHALTTAEHHVRPDGSTFHVVDFDPETGAVRDRTTRQGFAPASTWARGQAWALYGFTMAYRETRDPRFLETARRVADWYVQHLPEGGVPFWDFDAPSAPDAPRDASAAAIAASGLLELYRFAQDDAAARYREAAGRSLRALAQAPYLARGSGSPAILGHSTGDLPRGDEVDVSLVYADYYFVEALRRYLHAQEGGPGRDLGMCALSAEGSP